MAEHLDESSSRSGRRRPRVSLRIRILIGVSLAMSAGVGLIFVVGSYSVMGGFLTLEQRDARDSALRAQDALNQQIDGLDRTIANWSSWDDTYTWVDDHNDAFVQSNLNDAAMAQLGASALVFVDENGAIIASLIAEVQADTDGAVSAMDAGAAEVNQGSELAQRSGQAIDELASAVAATRAAAEQIGGRIQTMATASDGVVSAIREIDRIARDNNTSAEAMLAHASAVIGQVGAIEDMTTATADHAQEVSAAAEEMNAQAQTLAGNADSLVMTSRSLTRQTSQFRLPEASGAGESSRRAA